MENFDTPQFTSINDSASEITGSISAASVVAGSAYGLEATNNSVLASSALLPLDGHYSNTLLNESHSGTFLTGTSEANINNTSALITASAIIDEEPGQYVSNNLVASNTSDPCPAASGLVLLLVYVWFPLLIACSPHPWNL